MSNTRIDPAQTSVQVAPTTPRTTAEPKTPFKDVLAGGANALLTGAEVAGGALGGSVVAAAIRETRVGVANNMGGGGGGGGLGGPGVPGAESVVNAPNQSTEMAAMFAMQKESQSFNLQLLRLQEDVQTENRRFTTLSNVVRARHDTAKSAVGNVRS